MLTALLVAVLLPLVGVARAASQGLVAWVLGARPILVILGIGPALGRRSLAGVAVELRLLPLGGHVQWGAVPYPVPPPGPFAARLVLAISGPVATLLMAFAVFFGLHIAFQARTLGGRPVATHVVEMPTGQAVSAGVRPGDVIVAIDGQTMEYFDEIARIVGRSEGRPLQISVRRQQPGADPPVQGVTGTLEGRQVLGPRVDDQWQSVTLTVAPEPSPTGYRLGVRPKLARLGAETWGMALWLSAVETAAGLRVLFDPTPSEQSINPAPGDMAAPILHLIATLALLLFVVNLLLPAHDLHRLALLALELVARRPVSPRAEIAWVRVEVLILLVLVVLFLAWYVVRVVAPV